MIYLHGVTVKGSSHDVFFMTTTYGKTIAVDANQGTVLWEYTPPNFESWLVSLRTDYKQCFSGRSLSPEHLRGGA